MCVWVDVCLCVCVGRAIVSRIIMHFDEYPNYNIKTIKTLYITYM